jgi:hypothetical protein
MKRVLSVTFVSLLLAFSAVVVAQTRGSAPTTAPTIAPGAGEGTGAVQERAVDPRNTSNEARQPDRSEGNEDDINDGDDSNTHGTGGTP